MLFMWMRRVNQSKETLRAPGDALGLGILLALAVALFSPMLFGDKVIFYRDFTFVTFPFRYFLAQSFQQGAVPYWSAHVYGGMPFMAGFHPGVFYPPSIFLFLKDTTLALNLFYMVHFLILGFFSFLLARSWGISLIAALCCGITGMLSGFMVASVLLSNFFLAAVWLPMIFWLFHQFWMRRQIGYLMGLVLAIAAQTLAACPEICIMTVLLLYVHSVCFLPRAPGFSGMARIAGTLGLAVILALGLAALQLIPTSKLVEHSFRDQGLSYESHVASSLSPTKLSTLAVSPDYGDLLNTREYPSWFSGFLHTLYMGILGLALVLIGFIFRREKPIGFWLVVFLFGILLALGKYNPLYELVYPWVPLLNMFRFPEKYFFISSFAAVFLSGYVLDALIREVRERRLNIIPVLTLLILLFGFVLYLGMRENYLDPELPLVILLVFCFALVMFYYRKISSTVFAALVCILVVTDLGAKDVKLLPTIDRKFYENPPLFMDIVGNSSGKYRIYSGMIEKKPNPDMNPIGPTWMDEINLAKQYLHPFTGMVSGVEHAGGLPGLGLELRKHVEWYYAMIQALPEKRLRMLKRSNVKFWIDEDALTPFNAQGDPLILPSRVKVLEGALPRAFLVGRMKLEEDAKILDTYYDESFDPLSEVLLGESVPFEPSVHFNGSVASVTYRPNGVTVKTKQEGRGFLVLLDSFFPGWTVKVDGEEKPVLKANHFYRAVQLDSGSHTLEFEFFPEGFKEGLAVSAFALLVWMALPLGRRWQGRFAPSAHDEASEEKPVHES